MDLNSYFGVPIIEEPAPSGFAAQVERQRHAQIQAAIDRMRCPWCGSLAFETTLYAFSSGVEKLIECRRCGSAREENFEESCGLLAFLTGSVLQGAAFEE